MAHSSKRLSSAAPLATGEKERAALLAGGLAPRDVTPARLHSDTEPWRPNEFFHHNDQPYDFLSPSRARSGRFAAKGERECPRSHPRALFHGRRHQEKIVQEEQWDELSDDEQREA